MDYIRRHRNTTQPPAGRKVTVIKKPTPRDLEIFRLLDARFGYRFLSSHYIHHFVGGNSTWLVKRLGALKEAQNAFLLWPDQQKYSENAAYKQGVYELAPKGARAIGVEIPPLPKQEYAHELMRCIVEADFKIGAKKKGLRHIGWDELSVHPNTPAATRTSPDPFKIPLADGHMRADGPPFILATDIAGVQRRICIPCKEIDRDTEGLERTIAGKFRNYHEFMQRKLYASHFGFDNALIPFITTDESRMRGMMNLLGPCPYIIFKVVPDYALARHFPLLAPPPKPETPQDDLKHQELLQRGVTTDLITKPWKRMGYPDFSLVDMRPV